MDFRNFDVGLLIALDALLSEKSVTRAGERLHLSQPATSIILARLRRYFGNDLLVSTGRRMVLTPLAESLVQPVRNCLLQIQHTVASKAEFNPSISNRRFCLAVSDYVTAVLISQALQEIARQAPGITFELARLDETIEQRLEKGEIDFVIRPMVHALSMHPKEPLFEDNHTCVVWSKNSLIGKSLSRKQFLSLGHVSVHFGHASAIFEDWFSTRYGEIRKIEVVAQDFEVACRLVVGTNRIATVMSRMARLCAEHLPIRLIPPPFAIPTVTHCLQWHRYQDQDPGSIWLRALLKQVASKLIRVGHSKKAPGPQNRAAIILKDS
ncbi:MAG: LysR family transcriptional regulator [Acidobacteria bacterium]|nr:LysR family transcriptional regulator [Acidobacteriota bacterium]